MKTYKTIDNGGTAYYVTVDENVSVYKNMDTEENIDGEWVSKLLFTVTPEKVFGGKGSVLLKLKTWYRFIGHIIYDFLPVKGDTIVSFHSKIGNSDVDYPYAIGKTHVYLFLGKVAIEISYFDLKEDIYDQYYYEHRVKMALKNNPKSVTGNYKERLQEYKYKKVSLQTKLIKK
jgi:hypothetical protein